MINLIFLYFFIFFLFFCFFAFIFFFDFCSVFNFVLLLKVIKLDFNLFLELRDKLIYKIYIYLSYKIKSLELNVMNYVKLKKYI
jgi:hypothetical protein